MWFIQQFLLAFLFFLFFCKYLKMRWKARSLPPGPSPFPFIGNLWTMRFNMHPETFIKLTKLYGNMYTVWIGETPLIVLHGYKAVKNAIVSHSEELSGRPVTSFMADVTHRKGIVGSNGHRWRQQRRFGLMTLRNLGLGKRGLESRIQKEAQSLVEILAAQNGKPMDVSNFIIHSVANVICAVVFGHRFPIDDPSFQKLVSINQQMIEGFASKFGILYDAFPWLMKCLPGSHQEMFKNRDYIYNFVRNEIRIHQQNESPEEPNDLIHHYLAQIAKTSGDPNSTFDISNLLQVSMEFFTAGTETTATTLQWAIMLMLAYPDIQDSQWYTLLMMPRKNMYSSGWQVQLQVASPRLPPSQHYTQYSPQRWNPNSPSFPTRPNYPTVQLTAWIHKWGMHILPNLDSVLHDPMCWEKPDKFNPEHFLDKAGNFTSNEAFLPFSAGHRVCLGEQLARFELVIFFITLMRAFRFQLPKGVTEVNTKYIAKLTLQPQPFKVCVMQR
ncbi:cytochrome P450 2J4-like isoform X1 [Ranitomeya variabilis]|uniref:cytochrome P450 2J4-like isoform X1 n=1 Tax=Ranitomeya variabilis TaxID=490064 RepID=UPI004056BC40